MVFDRESRREARWRGVASEVGAAAGATQPAVAGRVALALARTFAGLALEQVVAHATLADEVGHQLELQDGEPEGDLHRHQGAEAGGLAAAGRTGRTGAGGDSGDAAHRDLLW